MEAEEEQPEPALLQQQRRNDGAVGHMRGTGGANLLSS